MQNERTPVVSVIMGVYNQYSEVQLLAAVNSILIQTFKDFEFIFRRIYDSPLAGTSYGKSSFSNGYSCYAKGC